MSNIQYMLNGKEINGRKIMTYSTRGSKVMFVAAHAIYEKCWVVYLAPVPGEAHAMEMEAVVRWGYKCERDLAEAIFPHRMAQLSKMGIPYRG
jgi:hypothetical protein